MTYANRLTTPPAHRWATLGHILDTVGPLVLRTTATGQHHRDHPVRATHLLDLTEELPDGTDTLLLASGLDTTTPNAPHVLRAAAERGFCGVVVKGRGAPLEEVNALASAESVALLVAADEVPWRHLDALILSVLGARSITGEPTAGSGDELFALANATAAIVGGSVAVEDLDRRVLAYSSLPGQRIDELRRQGILDRRVPGMDRHLAQYGAVLDAKGVVRFSAEEVGTPRAAVTVRAGDQPLGTIWAIEAETGLDSSGEQALSDAGRLAALHMLRRRDASELAIQARGQALRAALEGRMSVHDVEFRLAVSRGVSIALLGFSFGLNTKGAAAVVQLGAALARYFAVFHTDAAVTTTSQGVYVLVCRDGVEAAIRLANGAVASLPTGLRDGLTVGVSDVSSDPEDLPGLRRGVDDVLRAATTFPDGGQVAALADVRPQVLLAHVGDVLDRAPELRHPGVERMLAHDLEHRAEFARSVLAWLESAGDVASAARSLGVHANTVRYRLRRAEENFGIALGDPDTRLSVWMQIRTRVT